MANSLPERVIRFPTPPSSATDPPLPTPGRTQQLSIFVRLTELTKKQRSAILDTFLLSLLTYLLISNIVFSIIAFFPNRLLHCHVTFSVESVSVSPSSIAIWHVDFLVNHPSSRCHIYYDADGVYAKLGSINAAVLKTSHMRRSRGHTSFSVELATEGNQTSIVEAFPRVFDLEMKLSAMKKQLFVEVNDYGHIDIRCQNLNLGYDKIKCNSSFKKLEKCC